MSIRTVLHGLRTRGHFHDERLQREVLACWSDLFRAGIISLGLNFANPEYPHAHVTEHGRRTLENLSRDPLNKSGYLAALALGVPPNSVARSYVEEALDTYASGCHRASAVMIGAAAESLFLAFRDELAARLGQQAHKNLGGWRVKNVLDQIETECDRRRATMPPGLADRFSSYWSAFTSHLRLARNDAGHPKSVEPVTLDVVHGSLLIFPELAKLTADLRTWVASSAFVP